MIRNLRNNAIAILSMTLIVIGLVILAIQAVPIDVLKDWQIKVPNSSYQPSDTIVIESHAVKLRKAEGKAQRVIECDTGKDAVVSYMLNETLANRGPGTTNTGTPVVIPSEITNLPATCRVVITVHYTVFFGLRHITEYAVSNNFTVD